MFTTHLSYWFKAHFLFFSFYGNKTTSWFLHYHHNYNSFYKTNSCTLFRKCEKILNWGLLELSNKIHKYSFSYNSFNRSGWYTLVFREIRRLSFGRNCIFPTELFRRFVISAVALFSYWVQTKFKLRFLLYGLNFT